MIILACIGVTILVLVLRDVFQTVVVPLSMETPFRIAPFLVRNILWPLFRFAASRIKSPVWRAEILGLFGPFVFLILLVVWIGLLMTGFALVTFTLANQFSPHLDSLASAFYVAGASVLTMGTEYVTKTNYVRVLMLAEAFCGVTITALVISLLFTLIGSVQRREVLVSITSNIAGSPPSGIAILETHASINGRQSLNDFYESWHLWSADILDTHLAYPILPHFRSNNIFTSWLTALGAALDSASLLLSCEPDADLFSAKLMYRSGTMLIKELASFWELAESPPEELGAEEFHEIYSRLEKSGFSSANQKQVLASFQELRHEYISSHRALCDYHAVSQTPLSTNHQFQLITAKSQSKTDDKPVERNNH